MKVGVSGTHGTGKTTFALDIAKDMKVVHPNESVFVLQEVVPDCPLPINEQSTIESQLWMFSTHIAREIEACTTYDIVICDRIAVDYLAYSFEVITNDDIRDIVMGMRRIVNEWVQTYDRIYWLKSKPGEEVPADGVRSVEPDFRSRIDEHFRRLYEFDFKPVISGILI